MAKRKLSMAEKRKRRAKKLPPKPKTGKPVNFDQPPKEDASPAQTTQDVDAPQRAQELLAAQRESVAMLSHVRERVEALDFEAIQSSLFDAGYHVVDGFLEKQDLISKLQEEGLSLFEKDEMEVDLEHLGSGEYICKIEGGEDQYVSCPRSVELVVSVTKHLAPAFALDASACMAFMRTYSQKAQLASLELLPQAPERPMGVFSKGDDDMRRVSLLYFPISSEWSDQGGVTLENGDRIPAKRDRLILLKSDSCVHRKEDWEDGPESASCIELHLLQGDTTNES